MIVSNEVKKKLSELFLLCVEVTNENFTAFFEFQSHIEQFEIKVYKDGWKAGADYDCERAIDADDEVSTINDIISEIKSLKAESDIKYSPENIEKTAKENKAKEIAALKARLEKLEG